MKIKLYEKITKEDVFGNVKEGIFWTEYDSIDELSSRYAGDTDGDEDLPKWLSDINGEHIKLDEIAFVADANVYHRFNSEKNGVFITRMPKNFLRNGLGGRVPELPLYKAPMFDPLETIKKLMLKYENVGRTCDEFVWNKKN